MNACRMVVGVVAITTPMFVHELSVNRAGCFAVCLEFENQMGQRVVLRHSPRAILAMTC